VHPPKATVYTRQGCHLCEEAQETLVRFGFQLELVDIDCDPALIQRYGNCIPVVVIEGRERFRGRVNPRLLRRLLTEQAGPDRTAESCWSDGMVE
jgi:glutaredoxin